MLSSLFAGLAGVLLAPLFAQARRRSTSRRCWSPRSRRRCSRRLTSIPLALLGGLLLGIAAASSSPATCRPNSVLASGLRPSLPFVVLFLLLLFSPGLRNRREVTDPLAGVDPPPPALAAADRAAPC